MQVLQRMVLADLKLPVDQLVAKEADGSGEQRPLVTRQGSVCALRALVNNFRENVSTNTGTYPCCPESGNFLMMVV